MSMNHISLRQAVASDWPAIESLLMTCGLPAEGARAHLGTFLVAADGARVVGVTGAEVHGDVALLRSVAVASAARGQGLAESMVGVLIDQARRRGIHELFLLTTTAADYFTRFGFTRMARDAAPRALAASAEFQGACPASAVLMGLPLVDVARMDNALPVAVLGAGPVGLAAVARLLVCGLEPLILEAGPSVGTNLQDYGHVRLFSPWRYDIDPAMAALLAPTGWQAPPAEELPLAGEIVERVLMPFSQLPQVARALRLRTRVLSISRQGFDKVKSAGRASAPFVIDAMEDGWRVQFRARAVIDATGTWGTPNPVGANGVPAVGERENVARIFYGIPDVLGRDRGRYAGRRTLVVGSGHSAANALLDLAELASTAPGTRLAWAVRSATPSRAFGGGEADALPARGKLGSDLRALQEAGGLEFLGGLRISTIRADGDRLAVEGVDRDGRSIRIGDIDEIVCATGQRPDLSLTGELRLRLDPWLESTEALGPLIDPNLHSCGTVRPHGHRELSHPEPGFYTLGVKSYGRAPTFLMATGFEQARSVVAAIAGDLEAADRVELDLPETGVCSLGSVAASGSPTTADNATGCCGGTPKADASACCVLDEQMKAQGASGCGCSETAAKGPPNAVTSGCCGPSTAKPERTAAKAVSQCCAPPAPAPKAKVSCCG